MFSFLTFEFSFAVFFLQLTQYIFIVTVLLTTTFIVFDFIILSDLNPNPSNLAKILFIKAFFSCFMLLSFYHCLMCLNISLMTLKISKSSLSRSTLINVEQTFFLLFFVFLFRSQYFCHCFHFHHFLLRVYSHKNTSQFYDLKWNDIIMFKS